MAVLKGFQRSNPVSSFRSTGVNAGIGFDLIAQGLETMAKRAEPAAIEEMKRRGADEGYGRARAGFGGREVTVTGGSAPPGGNVIRDGLIQRGMPAHIADAFVVNFQDESGLNPGINEANPIVPGSRGGFGLAQWTGPRRRDLEAFAAARGAAASDPDVQLDFLMEELNGKESAAGKAIFASSNVATAATAIVNKFLRPSEEHRARRASRYANLTGRQMNVTQTAEPEVMVRTKSGSLEPRLFSPYSGPVLQAYNSAAGMAYQSEVLNSAQMDLLNISHQFEGNPEGFAQAAKGYVDQILESAPSIYRAGIREGVNTEIHRRQMGLMEEQQAETLKRANNSSAALVDRWSLNYAEAIAAGNTQEAEAARAQLDAVLRSREAMPGIAWTPEQSANVFMKAEREAQRIQARRDTELSKQAKTDLELVRDAAKAGLHAESEGILSDPLAAAMHPELAREAAAFVRLRDNMPEFLTMTPGEMAATVAQMREQPISEDWQMDIIDAAAEVAKAHAKGWADDPVKQAQETLATAPEGPPPELPDLSTADPQSVVAAFTARHDYMNRLFDEGYTDTRAYFSEDESEMLKAVMSRDTPAELRVGMAGAVVAGFGDDAVRVMDEIGGDNLTTYAGKMMAVTGNATTAAEILTGQQILAEGAISVPTNASFSNVFSTEYATAFAGLPPQRGRNPASDVIEAARAIYASRMVKTPVAEGDADAAMEGAMAAALGQATNKRGEVTGGVQDVLGVPTLLPPGIHGRRADAMLRRSLGALPHDNTGFWGGMANLGAGLAGDAVPREINETAWRAASSNGSIPMKNGAPLPPVLVETGAVQIVAAGPNGYRMEINYGSYVSDVEDENGNVLFFDLGKLIEEMQ